MSSNSKNVVNGVKGFAKNLMLRAMGKTGKGKLDQAKKAEDRKFAAFSCIILILALAAVFYYNNMSAQFIQNQQDVDKSEEPSFYVSMKTFWMGIATVTLVLCIRKVITNHQKDFRPSMYVEQITEDDFRHQQKHLTRQEVLKLQNDPLYKQLTEVKGKAIEDWNWQMKEASNVKREGKGSPMKGQQNQQVLLDDNDDSLEKELLKIDDEIMQEGGPYLKGGHKLVKVVSSQRIKRTPATQDTGVSKNQAIDEQF